MSAPLTDEIRSGNRSCRLGALVTMIDVAASDPVLAAWTPDWTATQDLSVNTINPIREGPVVLDTRLLRLGRKSITVSATVYDGRGIDDFEALQAAIDDAVAAGAAPTLSAKGLATFTRISRAAASGVDQYNPNAWLGKIRTRSPARYNKNNLYDRIGITICDAANGVVSVANSPYIANSIGTINGGVQAVIVEAAAEAMRPGMTVMDIQIHYLSQLRAGPVQTSGTLIRDARDHSVVSILLRDSGADNRVLATATLILQ